MSFILIPNSGEDLKVNAWNWRPTIEFLRSEKVIDAEPYERMGAQGCGGHADAALAQRIAAAIRYKLKSMHPGQRIRGNLQVTAEPQTLARFEPNSSIDSIDATNLYSATYDWLVAFQEFCERYGGFRVS